MDQEFSVLVENATIYQQEQLVLKQVNVAIAKGELVYLIGRVGSGKSTFIKSLNAEIPLFDGKMSVAGFSVDEIKRKEIPYLRRKLGVVFQDFKLLTDRTVYQNLLFVLKATGWTDIAAMKKRIDEMLEEVGMGAVKQKMPHQLSGGEQQRIVIARALLNNPEILLADEPTGNLDHNTSVEIMELFKKIHSEGKTILMATHDKLVVDQFPSRTLVCENNTINDFAPTDNLLDFREFLQ